MRLVAKVKITDYWQNVLLQKHHSVVSLHSAHGDDILLLVSPHYRTGIRYKVSAENVLQVSVKELFRNKLTMVLKEPPHKLEIHYNTFLLEKFGNRVRHLCRPVHLSRRVKAPSIPIELDYFRQFPQDLMALKLQTVPNEVMELEELSVCLLNDNNITSLPTSLKEMQRLRALTVSKNRMRIFPYNILPLNGFALDLSDNPFTSRYFVVPDSPRKHKVPTLKELAGRAVVDYRLRVSWGNVPQVLAKYLKRVRFCAVCLGAYFDSFVRCRYIATYRIFTEILPENEHLHNENFFLPLCSRRCMQPELKFCEVLDHLTPEQYDEWVKELL